MRPRFVLPAAAFTLLALAAAFSLFSRHLLANQVAAAAARQAALPRLILWVWERPEDLRTLHPGSTGAAVLEETLQLGSSVVPIPRRQPLLLPQHVQRIAVVRIQTDRLFAAHIDDRALLQAAVADLARVASQPNLAALEIDFDAKRSERAFYRRLLTELRQHIPPTLPLDITALVSWCTTDDWIGDLPINEATPMFFRMEPDRRRSSAAARTLDVHEPLCSASVGVSTGEPWPPHTEGKRVWLFADHGWSRDLATLPSTPPLPHP